MAISLPAKIEQREIPAGRKWDTKAVFDLETERLKKWIEESVNSYLSSTNSSIEDIRGVGATANAEIMNTFGSIGESVDQRLLTDAEVGRLEQSAPQEWRLLTYGFLKWVTGIAEVAIFIFSALIGATNYFVITVGVLLAVVGWILGLGISRVAMKGSRDITGLLSIALGISGVFSLSAIRAGGEFQGALAVIVITALVALLVAAFTALEAIGKEQLGAALREMFICQRWKAAMLHSKACQAGFWEKIFDQELEHTDRRRRRMERADLDYIGQTLSQGKTDGQQ